MNVNMNTEYDEFIKAYETLIQAGTTNYYSHYDDSKSKKEIKFIRMLNGDINESQNNGCYDGSVFRNRIMKANANIIAQAAPILKTLNACINDYNKKNPKAGILQRVDALKGIYIIIISILRLVLFSSHSQWINKLDIQSSIILFTLGINNINTDYRKYANIHADNDDIMRLAQIINSNDYDTVKNNMASFIMTNKVSYLNDFDVYILMKTRTPYDNHAVIEMINDNHLQFNHMMSNVIRNGYMMTQFIQDISMTDVMRVLNAEFNKHDYDNVITMIRNAVNDGYYDGTCMNNKGEYIISNGLSIITKIYENCILMKHYNEAFAAMMIAYYIEIISDKEDFNSMSIIWNDNNKIYDNDRGIASLSVLMVIIQNSTIFYEYVNDYPHEFIIESITALAGAYDEEFKSTHKISRNYDYDF